MRIWMGILLLMLVMMSREAMSQPVLVSKARPVNADVKYIQCATCRVAAYRIHQYMTANPKASEAELLELLELICDPYRPQGEWIPLYEIIRHEDGQLALKEHEYPGRCKSHCATISKACSNSIEDGIYEMAEYFITHRQSSLENIRYILCNVLNEVCTKEPMKAPDEWTGEGGFEYASEEDVQMDNLRRMAGGNVQVRSSQEMSLPLSLPSNLPHPHPQIPNKPHNPSHHPMFSSLISQMSYSLFGLSFTFQVLGSDELPLMMDSIKDMEDVDMGTDEVDEAPANKDKKNTEQSEEL